MHDKSPYYTITVRGRQHTWVFKIDVDPKYIKDWRADGLIIDEVVEVIGERDWWDILTDNLYKFVEQDFLRAIGLK